MGRTSSRPGPLPRRPPRLAHLWTCGLHVSVRCEPQTRTSMLHATLAGIPLAPPLELPGWEPQPGWTVRVRALGSSAIGTRLYRLRVESAAMSPTASIPMQVAVGPLFVSPQTAFVYYAPPVVRAGGVVPTSGPTSGGTVVRIAVANYSSTLGSMPDAALQLRCRFGTQRPASVVPAFHLIDANGTRLGLECTSACAHRRARLAAGLCILLPASYLLLPTSYFLPPTSCLHSSRCWSRRMGSSTPTPAGAWCMTSRGTSMRRRARAPWRAAPSSP